MDRVLKPLVGLFCGQTFLTGKKMWIVTAGSVLFGLHLLGLCQDSKEPSSFFAEVVTNFDSVRCNNGERGRRTSQFPILSFRGEIRKEDEARGIRMPWKDSFQKQERGRHFREAIIHTEWGTNICTSQKKFHTSFLERGSSPANIGLVSVAGMGNTWSRYLVESITGLFTGDVYRDPSVWEEFEGARVDPSEGSVFVVKSHSRRVTDFDKVILVVRNPMEAAIADYTRRERKSAKHTGMIKSDILKTAGFKIFHEKYVRRFDRFTDIWLSSGKVAHVISFERLERDFEGEVGKLSCALIGNINSTRLACLTLHRDGAFKRPSRTAKIAFPQSIEAIREANKVILRVDERLKESGFKGVLPLEYFVESLLRKYLVTDKQKNILKQIIL